MNIDLPAARHIDGRLVGGSLLFGVGWGIAGFCPGPALSALGMGDAKATVFFLALLLGMSVFPLLSGCLRRRQRGPDR